MKALKQVTFLLAFAAVGDAQFGRGDASWATPGADAQRSAWVRNDPKISKDGVQKPEFRFLWKIKLAAKTEASAALTPAVLLTKYIGYRGFRDLALVQSDGDSVYGIDTDLGRVEWNVHMGANSANCPAGLSAGLARPITTAIPALAALSGPGRSQFARSGVGEPGEGAVTLQAIANARPATPAAARPAAAAPVPQAPRRSPITIYVLDGDGMLHNIYVSNGLPEEPPVAFVPPNSAARGFIVANGVAYVAAVNCHSGGASVIKAMDLESKQVMTWNSTSAIAGSAGAAFGPDGTLYAATAGGDLVALDRKTLAVKETYAAKQEFITSPLIFDYKEKVLAAAATSDGSIHLLDTTALSSAPVYKTAPGNAILPGSLASYQDRVGRRWLLASVNGAISAWQLHDENGTLSLTPAWTSAPIAAPSAPIVINGVVFAASNSSPQFDVKSKAASDSATIYALDAATGKELWTSGKQITASAHLGSLAGGGGQIYLGTDDGTLWVFGSWIERQ
jgi:outer membrane protein assembly factor BamB